MLDRKIKNWSFVNSALLILITIVFIAIPEKIFVINQNFNYPGYVTLTLVRHLTPRSYRMGLQAII